MRYMLSSGVVMRLILGGLWLIVFGGVIDDFSGAGTALVWTVPAGVTWFLLVKHAAAHPARKPFGRGEQNPSRGERSEELQLRRMDAW